MRLILTILFITYFVGQYWFIFVKIITLINHDKEWGYPFESFMDIAEDQALNGEESFIYNGNWNFVETNGYE